MNSEAKFKARHRPCPSTDENKGISAHEGKHSNFVVQRHARTWLLIRLFGAVTDVVWLASPKVRFFAKSTAIRVSITSLRSRKELGSDGHSAGIGANDPALPSVPTVWRSGCFCRCGSPAEPSTKLLKAEGLMIFAPTATSFRSSLEMAQYIAQEQVRNC